MHFYQFTFLFGITGVVTLTNFYPLQANQSYVTDNRSIEAVGPVGTISGTVIDDTGLGMPGVLLKLDAENRYTVTDLDGNYIFLAVPESSYTMTASYLGYNEYTKELKVRANEDTRVDVHMTEEAITMNEVVVFGQLAKGQARALNIQKNNSNITNLVASDQIGRFPDSNIGDALKRIQGITIQTDQGEARNLVVRGLATALNSVTLDGGRIPSAEGDNRNVQLDLIPSEMIQVIEVNKTLLPDMEADAIGGSVNLKTKTAPERMLVHTNLGWGWNTIRNKPTYTAGFTYGNRYYDKKFGVVLALSFQDKIYGSDNVEGEWEEGENEQPDYLGEQEVRNYNVTRLRGSASLNLDYKFNNNHKIYLNTMFNYRNDYENRYAFKIGEMEPINAQNTLFRGSLERSIKMGAVTAESPDGRRWENQQMMHITLGGDHLLGSVMQMDWGGSFARALENKLHERVPTWIVEDVEIKGNYTDMKFPTFTSESDLYENYLLDELVDQTSRTHEDEWAVFANFRTPLSIINDQKGRLRFGGKVRIKSKVRNNDAWGITPLSEGSFDLANINVNRVQFGGKFLKGKYLPGTFPDARELGLQNWFDTSKFEKEDLFDDYWADNYEASENIYAAYLRWDQNISDKFLAIIGARVEHTAVDYIGNTIYYNEEGDPSKGEANKGQNSYTNIFPNLTLRYQPMDELVLRAAYSTSIARPNYYDLVPYLNVNREDHEVSLGNPNLKSTYAHNVDVIATYYPGDVSQITLGGFYKHLTNFIFSQTLQNLTASEFGQLFPQFTGTLSGDDKWDVYTRLNGSSVDLYGFEVGYQQQLSFLPGFLKGFSLYANYTYTHSSARGITNEDGDANGWFESGPCSDIEIYQNRFINALTARYQFTNGVISIVPNIPSPIPGLYYHGRVVIRDNEFYTFPSPLYYIQGVRELILKDNRIFPNNDYAPIFEDPHSVVI